MTVSQAGRVEMDGPDSFPALRDDDTNDNATAVQTWQGIKLLAGHFCLPEQAYIDSAIIKICCTP